MKYLLLILLVLYSAPAFAQQSSGLQTGLQNNGRIVNIGTIRLLNQKSLVSTTAAIITNRAFETDGTLILSASQNTFAQDTLLGWTRFIQHTAPDSASQLIPQITYSNLAFSGRTRKMLALRQNLVVLDSLFTDSTHVRLELRLDADIEARGGVLHNGSINPNPLNRNGLVRLNGSRLQTIGGSGVFKELAVDNLNHVSVVNAKNQAGFHVESALYLVRGEFRNSASNTFALGDEALIVRSNGSSLLAEPAFGKQVTVRYVGRDGMTSTGELPLDSTRLKTLEVLNIGGVRLGKHITVNDSLVVGSQMEMGSYVLTFKGVNARANPIFTNDSCEITGSVRRSVELDTLPRLFNNRHTFVQLANPPNPASQAAFPLRYLTLRITPNIQPEPDANASKIRRSIVVAASDARFQPVTLDSTYIVRIGYGWRTQPAGETNGLNTSKVLLQRWNDAQKNWLTVGVPLNRRGAWNTASDGGFWLRGVTDSVRASSLAGYFALGVDSDFGLLPPTFVSIRAVLEGAYIPTTDGQMYNELQRQRLIPSVPPNVHPFSLLRGNRPQVAQIPDSTVDWVVLELRRSLIRGADSIIPILAFLLQSGAVKDVEGSSLLRFQRSVDDTVSAYYVVLHHRNHLSVMTASALTFKPNDTLRVDFMNPQTVLGGTTALTFLGVSASGKRIFAASAGDVDADGTIGRADYDNSPASVWQQILLEGYLSADTNLDGIVTTNDANVSWNNRGKASVAPVLVKKLR